MTEEIPVLKKKCNRCRELFPISGFHKNQNVCKKCNYANVKEWRQRNPEMARTQDRLGKYRRRVRQERLDELKRDGQLPVVVDQTAESLSGTDRP